MDEYLKHVAFQVKDYDYKWEKDDVYDFAEKVLLDYQAKVREMIKRETTGFNIITSNPLIFETNAYEFENKILSDPLLTPPVKE